jgi:tRNA-modifying protein YgfZ
MHYTSPEHQIVTFDGVDALSFLQSQLTNDVAALPIGDWQWQGYCNAKGRLHATFALARTGDSSYSAVVHSSVVPFLVKRLTMFRLRSKLTIAVAEQLAALHHFSTPETHANIVATLDLGHGRWITIQSREPLQLNNAAPDLIGQWKAIGVKAKQPEIVAETNEQFVPQMIGWDQVLPGGGVSFSKGCYPGQEVVARAHYRGAVKRRSAVQMVPLNTAPGTTLARDDGTEIDVVNVAPLTATGNAIALVVEPIPT